MGAVSKEMAALAEMKKLTPDERRAKALERLDALQAKDPEKAAQLRAFLDGKEEGTDAKADKAKAPVFTIPVGKKPSKDAPWSPPSSGSGADLTSFLTKVQESHTQLHAHVAELSRRNETLTTEMSQMRAVFSAHAHEVKTQAHRTHALLRRFASDSGVPITDGE